MERDGLIDDENCCQFSKDMCGCGKAEHIDGVRGKWLEMGDADVLGLFEKYGSVDDLAELEISLEKGAPEDMVRKAIQAIKGRS